MDSYIVRIYRRTEEPPELAGQVEKAGTNLKENFHNSGELVRVLMSGGELCGGVGLKAESL
jgi:hypothetical protein